MWKKWALYYGIAGAIAAIEVVTVWKLNDKLLDYVIEKVFNEAE